MIETLHCQSDIFFHGFRTFNHKEELLHDEWNVFITLPVQQFLYFLCIMSSRNTERQFPFCLHLHV